MILVNSPVLRGLLPAAEEPHGLTAGERHRELLQHSVGSSDRPSERPTHGSNYGNGGKRYREVVS